MQLALDKTAVIHDSTKVEEYQSCARSYFYKYVLGWQLDRPNVHLEFGKAWHIAQEYLTLAGLAPEHQLAAFHLFNDAYREAFPDDMTDPDRAPKIPTTVMKAIPMYAAWFESMGYNFKPLFTEIGGTVPISDNRIIHFKMDSILFDVNTQLIISREHKTASQMSRQNKDKWKLTFQTGTYNHVLLCMYPAEKVGGVEINLAVFTKGKIVEFATIPVRRSVEMMEVWLWEANQWMQEIEDDFSRLLSDKCMPDHNIMECFKRNPTGCTAYTGCEYADFCISWHNPLQHINEVPEGFKIEFWDPTSLKLKHHLNFPSPRHKVD